MFRNAARAATRTRNAFLKTADNSIMVAVRQQRCQQPQQRQLALSATSGSAVAAVFGGGAALLTVATGAAVAEAAKKDKDLSVKFSTKATAETALGARYDT